MKLLPWTSEQVAAFEAVCSADPFGELLSPAELLHGCYLYEYQRGQQAALVALRREVSSQGVRVHIQGLASTHTGHIQTRHLMQEIEDTALTLGADVLSLCTQHKAIVHGAKRWGGHVTGAIITKYLRTQ